MGTVSWQSLRACCLFFRFFSSALQSHAVCTSRAASAAGGGLQVACKPPGSLCHARCADTSFIAALSSKEAAKRLLASIEAHACRTHVMAFDRMLWYDDFRLAVLWDSMQQCWVMCTTKCSIRSSLHSLKQPFCHTLTSSNLFIFLYKKATLCGLG